jgi:uncharacterized protein (TIGR02466 family)
MKRTDVFVCPIWSFENLPLDNSKLEQHAYRLREKYPEKRNPESYQTVNILKWKSYDLTTKDFLATPELNKLVGIVTESVNKCFLEMNPRENVTLQLSDVWYNIYDTGSTLESHPHPGNCVSATYYIKMSKDCGDFVLSSPDKTIPYQYSPKYFANRNEITREKLFITPEAGTLLCIPSNLTHWVTVNKADEQRISISFNYKVVDVNPFPPNHKLFKP